MDFPNVPVMPTHISVQSRYCNGPTRHASDGGATWSSGATVANQQWLVPLILPAPFLVASFFICAGTSPGTTNFDMAIYQAPAYNGTTMTRLVSTGATACVNTTNNVQIVVPSGGSKLLDRGNYYLGFVSANAGMTTISHLLGSTAIVIGARAAGICIGSSSATFGATTTQSALPVATITNRLPLFGISRLASGY
jgi:hypothetical protein